MNENMPAFIEAILMASTEPVSVDNIAEICEIESTAVLQLIAEINNSYEEQNRGFRIAQAPNGYRFVTASNCHDIVSKFITEPMNAKLTPSAMETLAVIAYKQPVSRGQISSIRGVNADGVIKTLESRGYIAEIGRDPGPGQAILYGTTPEFLERLGLNSIKELPSLGDFVPDPSLMEQFEKSILGESDSKSVAKSN